MTRAIISFVNLSKSFKKQTVLDGLSLDILEGEILGIVGKSGCGKSVLLRTLFGFVIPDFGQLFFAGEDVAKNPAVVREKIGFATQEDTFYHKLTVNENITYYAKLYDVRSNELKKRAAQLLELFKLSEHTNALAEKLSGGMKKRLCLAISLIHDPDVFLLDEPTVGLDPMIRDDIWSWIKKINALGKTVIVVSHLFEELERNCHRIAVMNRGKILCVGSQGTYNRLWPGKNLNQVFDELIKADI